MPALCLTSMKVCEHIYKPHVGDLVRRPEGCAPESHDWRTFVESHQHSMTQCGFGTRIGARTV